MNTELIKKTVENVITLVNNVQDQTKMNVPYVTMLITEHKSLTIVNQNLDSLMMANQNLSHVTILVPPVLKPILANNQDQEEKSTKKLDLLNAQPELTIQEKQNVNHDTLLAVLATEKLRMIVNLVQD